MLGYGAGDLTLSPKGRRGTPFGESAPSLRTGIEYGGQGASGHEVRLKLDTRF